MMTCRTTGNTAQAVTRNARRSPGDWRRGWRARGGAILGVCAIALSSLASPAIAGDPFRRDNPRDISDTTEQAFEAFFKDGNYPLAATYVERAIAADGSDPIVYAMKASLIYLDDPDELPEAFRTYAQQTLDAADRLIVTDALRGNLYLAVGHFLEGAYVLTNDGVVRGMPTALEKLQQVFRHLDRAGNIDPTDPELNIIKGYMDLILAVNLPFTDPELPIERLRTYAAPEYLAQRGLAVGFRDLERFGDAMAAVDRSLELTPNNPEVMYLKAQIFVEQGDLAESLPWFDRALAMQEQLPEELVEQIQRERRKAGERLETEGEG